MLKSMTGFGRCEETADGYTVQIQIKSVNHRYSDFIIKLPRTYSFLEEPIRTLAAQKIARGKVEITVSIERQESGESTVAPDLSLAKGYIDALRSLTEYGLSDDLTLSSMTAFREIFVTKSPDIDEGQLQALVQRVFVQAENEFIDMRCAEGARLAESVKSHLTSLLSEIDAIEARSPQCIEEYRDRLYRKLTEVLADAKVDESRIITEAAIYADKIAVDEETVRLRSHIKAFEATMNTDLPVGKKLDFIVQEMNREANTIGSKCSDLTVASHVVEVKSLIEKIREQIQNIE